MTRPQFAHLLCGLRTDRSPMAEALASDLHNNGQNQARLPLAAKLHTITTGA
jgi:hypothetical protein